MTTSVSSQSRDRTVLGSAWEYRWLVLALIVIFAGIAYVVSSALPTSNVARASILLEDPTQQTVLSDAQIASDRIIQNQLEVFRSSVVAERAVEIAAEEGVDLSLGQLLTGAAIVNVPDTDLISISYNGASEEEALIVTTAMLRSYVETRAAQSEQATARILERLDSAADALEEDLASVQAEIGAVAGTNDFDGQINELLAELGALENQISETSNADQRAVLLDRQREMDERLRTLQLAKEIDEGSSELVELNQRRDEIMGRIEAIDLERSDVEIEAQSAGDGIAFVDEAKITSVSAGAGTLFTLAVGAFLGLLIGLGWAYSLAQRRTTIDDRMQPEAMFDVPLLGDIPKFGRHASGSSLPVVNTPRSPVSEAFRFTSNSIELALSRRGGKGVVFLSNQAGEGKTALIANTALAASRQGKQVLVVDADFGNQELTTLLLGDATGSGLTELASEQALLRDVVKELKVDGFGSIDVLQRGQLPDPAPDFFERESVRRIFRDLMMRYDLVFVDVPPLMQVAYTSTIANLVENAVVVIRKGAELQSAHDLLKRARFIGVDILGYIYNSGASDDGRPLMGSLRNVLGDRAPSASARSGGEPLD
ncbi:MAG: AAA family ATPase [Acidimicrobiia bacterium]